MSLPSDATSQDAEGGETRGIRVLAYWQFAKVASGVILFGVLLGAIIGPYASNGSSQARGGLVDNAAQQAALEACTGVSKPGGGKSGIIRGAIYSAQSQECFSTGINCKSVIDYCHQRKGLEAAQLADSSSASEVHSVADSH